MRTTEEKTYTVKGYVQVEVYAEIKASSLEAARRKIRELDRKYGKGNGTTLDYSEGNWCSPVEIESIEEDS